MSDLEASTRVRWKMGSTLRGPDGFSVSFDADDSFRSWRQIVRWNLHFRHWAALRMNARDLFTKVIWRKVRRWRQS